MFLFQTTNHLFSHQTRSEDMDASHNHWGSSLYGDAPDAVKSGKVKVTVPRLAVEKRVENRWKSGRKAVSTGGLGVEKRG